MSSTRSLSTGNAAPSMASGRGFEPVATMTCFARSSAGAAPASLTTHPSLALPPAKAPAPLHTGPGGSALSTDTVFELLGDRTRRRLLKLIYDHHEVCVCRLVGGLAEPQPKISRHLALMRRAHLLRSRRDRTWVIYALDPQVPAWAVRVIQQLAEGSEADPVSAADRARMGTIKVCGTQPLPAG